MHGSISLSCVTYVNRKNNFIIAKITALKIEKVKPWFYLFNDIYSTF